MLEAQEAHQRADALIAEIDRIVRARFSAELMSRGPSPLRPGDLGGRAARRRRTGSQPTAHAVARRRSSDPETRGDVLRRLPVNLLLVAAGLAIAFVLRRLARGLGRGASSRSPTAAHGGAGSWRCAT